MDEQDILKVRITTPEEICHLGVIFGCLYLQPLVDSGIPEIESPVVGAYGLSSTGKSSFFRGSASVLSPDTSWQFKTDSNVESHIFGNAMFRHCDFGHFAHGINRRTPIFEARVNYGSRGVDFCEHIPLSVIRPVGAAIIIAHEGYAPTGSVEWAQWTGDVARELTQTVKSRNDSPDHPSLYDKYKRWLTDKMYSLAHRDEMQSLGCTPRDVSIIPVGKDEHELVGKKFECFRKEVKSHFKLDA